MTNRMTREHAAGNIGPLIPEPMARSRSLTMTDEEAGEIFASIDDKTRAETANDAMKRRALDVAREAERRLIAQLRAVPLRQLMSDWAGVFVPRTDELVLLDKIVAALEHVEE